MKHTHSICLAVACGMSTVPLLAQAAAGFEVATVKPSSAANGNSSGISTGDGRVSAKNVTLRRCIVSAYEISPRQIVGGPAWLDSMRFDIEAKSENPTADDAELDRETVQLLADRFHLKVHVEQRPTQVYVLEQAPSGTKLKPDNTGEDSHSTSSSDTKVTMQVTHGTMESFANHLSRSMDRPVVNKTDLPGTYRFTLQWTPERAQLSEAGNGDSISIFTAIQEQLGLRLHAAKVPVATYVIDSASLPTDN